MFKERFSSRLSIPSPLLFGIRFHDIKMTCEESTHTCIKFKSHAKLLFSKKGRIIADLNRSSGYLPCSLHATLTSNSTCLPCEAGFYCPKSGMTAVDPSYECIAGFYSGYGPKPLYILQ